MSEIDFDEIEKAMAELVSKAQGKQRAEQLEKVTEDRDEQAKKAENRRAQGQLATKRIVVATSSRGKERPSTPAQPPVIRSGPSSITDFKVKPQTIIQPKLDSVPKFEEEPAQIDNSEEELEENLTKSVGELSEDYLQEEVRHHEHKKEEESKEPPENPEPTEKNSHHDRQEPKGPKTTSIEDLTGPIPGTEPNLGPTDDVEEEDSKQNFKEFEDEENLLDKHNSNLDKESRGHGIVHGMYGQKLPKEYLQEDSPEKKLKEFAKHKKQKPENSNKKGLGFYLLVLLFLCALASWGLAAYIYFSAASG